ncbi:uncharacterized protein V1513DRAFT_426147 [Lipomyces chichibuensis]|uniref:uncharacterized protein n=1 Tax=Lipomyces chichibuensis TaxID=1546026 RepID=UPI00334354B2
MSAVITSSETDLKPTTSTLSTATTLADVRVPAQSHASAATFDPTTTFVYDYRTDKERGEKNPEEPVPKKILGLRSCIFWILAISLLIVVCVTVVLVVALKTRNNSSVTSNSFSPTGTVSSSQSRVYMKRLIDDGGIL